MADSEFFTTLQFARDCANVDFALKDKQIQTLKSLYDGHDTLAVLPTGFGKSIIFQLFLSCCRGHSVDPLNSIMQDQVHTLSKRGIPVCFLNIEGTGVKTFVAGKRYVTVCL